MSLGQRPESANLFCVLDRLRHSPALKKPSVFMIDPPCKQVSAYGAEPRAKGPELVERASRRVIPPGKRAFLEAPRSGCQSHAFLWDPPVSFSASASRLVFSPAGVAPFAAMPLSWNEIKLRAIAFSKE